MKYNLELCANCGHPAAHEGTCVHHIDKRWWGWKTTLCPFAGEKDKSRK